MLRHLLLDRFLSPRTTWPWGRPARNLLLFLNPFSGVLSKQTCGSVTRKCLYKYGHNRFQHHSICSTHDNLLSLSSSLNIVFLLLFRETALMIQNPMLHFFMYHLVVLNLHLNYVVLFYRRGARGEDNAAYGHSRPEKDRKAYAGLNGWFMDAVQDIPILWERVIQESAEYLGR